MPRRIPSKYRAYFKVLEELGLEQLDVYRLKDRDVLRLRDTKGKVMLVELPGYREDIDIESFRKILLKALQSS